MTRDPLGPDGWDGELPTPPATEVRWERVFGLLAEVDGRRGAPPGLPGEPLYTDDGILIVDRSGASSPIATSLGVLVETDLIETGFDWIEFVSSPRGLLLDEGLCGGEVGDMTLEECRMILVAFARQERFGVGEFDAAIRSGMVSAVLRRAMALVQD